jgi:DNA ligase-1
VLLEAIAHAAEVPASAVRRALLFAGGMAGVAEAALFEGERGLSRFSLQLFRPLSPMLADSAAGLDEVMVEGLPLALEHKLDGARIQVHRAGADVRVFSRQGNDVTESVPEIVSAALALPGRELVLDGEAIVLSPAGRPEPFQTTMRRFGRRSDVAALQKELPLSAFFFDCLQVDGQLLVDGSNEQRVAALTECVAPEARVVRAVTAEAAAARSFLQAALAAGHEGVVAKTLSSTYEAGRRGAGWRKVKPAHTLDLVVLAAEWGNGRRSGWLSNLHLGARDPQTSTFIMLGKTFKGLTDATLTWQTQRLRELSVGQSGHVVHVLPELVVEIAFDGLQSSSRYPGGLALRFARVKRYRPDKRAEDADTMSTVRAFYERSRTAVAEAGSDSVDATE